jgi:hypothetical protein
MSQNVNPYLSGFFATFGLAVLALVFVTLTSGMGVTALTQLGSHIAA